MFENLFKKSVEPFRAVHANDSQQNARFPSNAISNTKYSIITFIPKNLLEQFRKFMNLYFLFIGVLQLFPQITPVNPWSTWGAIIFIFALSASKEAYDDYNRYKRDKIANERKYWILDNNRGEKRRVMSKDIHVGDIIFLEKNEEIPCDVVVLATSEPEGVCYIQTANLDGETDFKTRQAPQATQRLTQHELANFKGIVECAAPNAEIYKFDSRMSMHPQASSQADWIPLRTLNLVLQATHLRNTDWIWGLVVYTGNDTKVGQSKKTPPAKWTKLDRAINKVTIFVFAMQLSLVVLFGSIGETWRVNHGTNHWYLQYPQNPYYNWYEWIIIPLRFLLLNSTMIPISLKVTMDLVKYAYALIIMWDTQMYHPDTDSPAVANNTAISEDLGQVQYLFSDKTGTLTENIMVFKKCYIDHVAYECPESNPSDIASDTRLVKAVADNRVVNEFFCALALCHTVIPSRDSSGILEYKASSPDEEALVHAAANVGVSFIRRDTNSVDISVNGDVRTYDWLHVLEFSSDRKRMSVVVREQKSSRIFLYSKGADDMIFARLHAGESKPDINEAVNHVNQFAELGLRTLCIGCRQLDNDEYAQWHEIFSQAAVSLTDRAHKLEQAYELLEKDLHFLGVTAIEDKLQDFVPLTIETIRAAGVKVWMLTGDKQSTAIQIGISSNLVSHAAEVIKLDFQPNALDSNLPQIRQKVTGLVTSKRDFTIVVEGSMLSHILRNQNYTVAFFEIAMLANSVICCRLTPAQKADVVRYVKNQNHITLAIGDGGNDQLMIQEADVGVGIVGREGLQAARAADYSIGRFHFLRRLMLVHGRYSYHRSAFVASYSFYKSLFICFIQILYEFYAVFAGTSFFNSLCLMSYNVAFTGLPVMGFIFDKDLPENTVKNNPFLYRDSQLGRSFNVVTIVAWFIRALYQAIAVFLITAFIYKLNPEADYASLSLLPFTVAIFIQTFTIVLESHSMTIINHVLVWGTLIAYFIVITLANAVPILDMYYAMYRFYAEPTFWLSILVITVVSLMPVITLKFLFFNYFPTSTQIIEYLCHYSVPFKLPKFIRNSQWSNNTSTSYFTSSDDASPSTSSHASRSRVSSSKYGNKRRAKRRSQLGDYCNGEDAKWVVKMIKFEDDSSDERDDVINDDHNGERVSNDKIYDSDDDDGENGPLLRDDIV